ncbi:MAG: ABC transporter permease [Longimicrobiales bacterium]|nr:ABC transporter permease [Longimicrobiales bacterium]
MNWIRPVLALLVVSLSAFSVVALILAPLDDGPVRMVEPPVPAGAWQVGWGRDVLPPAVEQASQLRGLRAVAAGAAALGAVLTLMTLLGLWRQRLRLRRPEDEVHRALGARRAQRVSRVVGAGWRWAFVALGASLAVIVGLPRALAGSFPGAAEFPPPVGALLILGTALAVPVVRREGRAGEPSSRPVADLVDLLVASPVAVAAVGLAILHGGALLSRHGPLGKNVVISPGTRVSTAMLPGDAPPWLTRIRDARLPVGVASAGAARGTGHRSGVWVDCGRCSEGGLPLPVRTVSAELHAVAPDTFTHLGITLLRGRDFTEEEEAGPLSAAIVSRSLAARHFEGGEAVGRRVRFGQGPWVEVVGIVADRSDVRDPTEYAVYLPLAQARPTVVEVLASDPAAADAALALLPRGTAISPPAATSELFAVHAWFTDVLRLLGRLALILVVVGVWVGARSEAQAARFEVALRRALGARRRQLALEFAGRSVGRLVTILGVGAWLSLLLGTGLERAWGSIPLIDPQALTQAAAPIAAAFLLGSLPSFVSALRATPACGMDAPP